MFAVFLSFTVIGYLHVLQGREEKRKCSECWILSAGKYFFHDSIKACSFPYLCSWMIKKKKVDKHETFFIPTSTNPQFPIFSSDLPLGKTSWWWWWGVCVPLYTAQPHRSCSSFMAWWQTHLWIMSARSKSWKIPTRLATTILFTGLTTPCMKRMKTPHSTAGKSFVYSRWDCCYSKELLLLLLLIFVLLVGWILKHRWPCLHITMLGLDSVFWLLVTFR